MSMVIELRTNLGRVRLAVAVYDVHHYISPSASKAIDSQTIIM